MNGNTTSLSVSQALGVPPVTIESKKLVIEPNGTTKVKEDFDYVRQNQLDLSKAGSDAVASLAQLAAMSQDPEAFNALSNLMRVVANINKDIMTIQKTVREIDKSDTRANSNNDQEANVVNSLIITTSELQKRLNKLNE